MQEVVHLSEMIEVKADITQASVLVPIFKSLSIVSFMEKTTILYADESIIADIYAAVEENLVDEHSNF